MSEAIEAAYRKVTTRLVPFLFLCYFVAYLDRVNVGFAKLQMQSDLKLGDATYGFGAGIFFIGYFLFEVPSNILMHRVGARAWIARIMISWGLVSSLTMFVKTPTAFYVSRFLLGIVEAGFFPGVILYLTYWYPHARRARMTALFMTAVPVTGVLGSPLSGWIMKSFAGSHGWAGWQWLFLLEGIPSILVGTSVLFVLDDGIQRANWLTSEEKALLEAELAHDAKHTESLPLAKLFANPKIWALSAVYFGLVMGLYGLGFWLPSLVREAGVSDPLDVGLLTAIPYGVATVAMVFVGRSADRRNDRRWHVALPALCGAVGLIASTFSHGNLAIALATLTIATAGILAALPPFWSLPTSYLGGVSAAAGIALVNSIGNLAGFLGPYLVGFVKTLTKQNEVAMYILATSLVLAAALVAARPTGAPARASDLL